MWLTCETRGRAREHKFMADLIFYPAPAPLEYFMANALALLETSARVQSQLAITKLLADKTIDANRSPDLHDRHHQAVETRRVAIMK